MKKTSVILLIILTLSGCVPNGLTMVEENKNPIEGAGIHDSGDNEYTDPLKNYPDLDENLKAKLRKMYILWKEFDEGKMQDKDPTEDFHNSEYIAEFKDFLSQRKSLEVSGNEIRWILEQYDYEAIDKIILLSNGKEYNIRIINYNVDYYVQAITDFIGLRNKWVFVQCWNDEEFYYTMLSDGDIHTVHDFFPMEIDGVFHIVLMGKSFPYYPQPPFLWAWHLETDGFKQSDLFDFHSVETDEYFIYDSVDFDNNYCLLKWTFQTDGAFIALEKSEVYEGDAWPDYFNVDCETKDGGKMFMFTSLGELGEINSTIQISLVNGRFAID